MSIQFRYTNNNDKRKANKCNTLNIGGLVRDALVIEDRDNVAVAIHPLKQGSIVQFVYPSGKARKLKVNQGIPLFHKFALADIPKGSQVIKYGEYIGIATQDIKAGDWVHTHNLASTDSLKGSAGESM